MAKASNAEMELRIQTVYEMIVKGATRPFILRYSSENWKIGERQTEKYIAEANKRIQTVFNDKDRERLINEHRSKLSDLYVKNYTIEDFRECRNVLESERKLLGLDEPDRKDINIKGKIKTIDPTKLSDEALKELTDAWTAEDSTD